MSVRSMCLLLMPLLVAACIATPDDFEHDRQHLATVQGSPQDDGYGLTIGNYDEQIPDDRFRLLPSEIERAAFERRLRPMVCVISERAGYKGQIQNVGTLVGALCDLHTDDPVKISAVYLMDSGVYLERIIEIPRAEIVDAFEVLRGE